MGFAPTRPLEPPGLMACESSGVNPEDHFVKTNKVIVGGKGARVARVVKWLKIVTS